MPITQLPVVCSNDSEILVTKGASKSLQLSFGVDLTGSVVQIVVKRSPTALDILLTKNATITPPSENGKAQLDFVSTDYASVGAGFYVYTISKITGADVTVLTTGRFVLEPFDQTFVAQIEPIMRLAITNSMERLGLEVLDSDGVLADPVELQVNLLDFSDSRVVQINLGDPNLIHPEAGIFMFDFQSNRAGDFLAIWNYRFLGEESQTVVKNIRWVTPGMFRMIPEIRLYIDKARKASNKTIAFNPVDCAEYIQNSLRDFNQTPPTTGIQLEAVSEEYKEIIVMGAIVQSLIAQGLLAVDQDFQYNDNGISLSIDHHTKLLSWYTTLVNLYIAKKRAVKFNFFHGTVLARTIVGQAFALGFSKIAPGTAARFRGWI